MSIPLVIGTPTIVYSYILTEPARNPSNISIIPSQSRAFALHYVVKGANSPTNPTHYQIRSGEIYFGSVYDDNVGTFNITSNVSEVASTYIDTTSPASSITLAWSYNIPDPGVSTSRTANLRVSASTTIGGTPALWISGYVTDLYTGAVYALA